MHAGETFEPAKPAQLEAIAKSLLTAANDKSATSPRTRKQCLSPSQEKQMEGQQGCFMLIALKTDRSLCCATKYCSFNMFATISLLWYTMLAHVSVHSGILPD